MKLLEISTRSNFSQELSTKLRKLLIDLTKDYSIELTTTSPYPMYIGKNETSGSRVKLRVKSDKLTATINHPKPGRSTSDVFHKQYQKTSALLKDYGELASSNEGGDTYIIT